MYEIWKKAHKPAVDLPSLQNWETPVLNAYEMDLEPNPL